VASYVDGVLLNIRISKYARPNVERAKEILGTLGVSVLGIVVNGVDPRAGASGYSYGYKNYHYRNGYGHTNGHHGDDREDADRAAPQAGPTVAAHRPNMCGRMQPIFSKSNRKQRRSGQNRSDRSRSSFLRKLFGQS